MCIHPYPKGYGVLHSNINIGKKGNIMNKIPTPRDVVLGSVIFILLYSIGKNEKVAKAARKRIIRETKKQLAIFRNHDSKLYLKLISLSAKVIDRARDKMATKDNQDLSSVMITPSGLLDYLEKREPGILDIFNYSKKHREDLTKAYSVSKLGFNSLKYANRILGEIDIAVEEAMSIKDEELKTIVKDTIDSVGAKNKVLSKEKHCA